MSLIYDFTYLFIKILKNWNIILTNWTTIKKFTYTTEVDTDTLPTGRTYHTPDGSYPSITTILGKTSDQTWLLKWKERVGEEENHRNPSPPYTVERGRHSCGMQLHFPLRFSQTPTPMMNLF